ncbi:PIG-P-domain-containing protein [Myriangium duriaei CBS 260.36]|uniref:PIG-P-domain-containing protein n=1 Tax=Myriangium duriaei CBS 260.36 TaxID=1168546 RepID=A0A9P4MMA2_9PEZI|nr:PIG-P-domain-containing protein [Myriangium duriaei CBS 260.36]
MPPQSRGNPLPTGLYSKSTPNLPTLRSFPSPSTTTTATTDDNGPRASTDSWTSGPSEPASIDDFSLSASSASSDSDTTPLSHLPARRIPSRSTTYLGPAAFAPPFYNRPPTPLPPSPSLTSLLRPAFSAHPSRPTSPDHSSDDGSAHVASTAVSTLTSSFRTARPVARASPKVPTYEYYGFTLYLSSTAMFTFYLLWAFLPSPFLHQLGIHYYPNRWWALAVPAWLVMAVVWCYVALAGWNTERETLGLGDVRTVVDEAAKVAGVDSKGRMLGRERRGTVTRRREREREGGKVRWTEVWDEGTDAVMDIPVGGVCEVLYGEGREREEDEDEDLI